MRWEKLSESNGMRIGKRWGHTCNAIKDGNLVYVFGGYGLNNSHTNQLHVFHTDTQTWNEPVIKGIPPTPRDSHTCTAVGDNLFVFGGTDGLNPLKDLHIFDTSSNSWISPTARGDGPEAREGHGAAVVGKQLFIFGGSGKSVTSSKEVYYNDLFVLDTETLIWQRAITSGRPPTPRENHSCSSWKNKIVVIGGEDENDYYLSDVYILDTDSLIWRQLNTSGQLMPPRAGHSTIAFGKHVFVFGGFSDEQSLYEDLYMLDVDTGVWVKIMPSGNGPSARFSTAGDCLDPSKGGVLVFIGGCDKNLEALDDMYYLHTGLVRDDGRDERRLEKLSLRKQLKMKCQEQYNLSPANDSALVTVGTAVSTPISVPNHGQQRQQYFHLNMYRPPAGKRTFQGKVTKNFANGYTIETVIDGKPLRGILFSTSSTTNLSSDGKKGAGIPENKLDGDQGPVTSCSTSHEPRAEVAGSSVSKNIGHQEGLSQHEGSFSLPIQNLVKPLATPDGPMTLPTNQEDDQLAPGRTS